MKKTLPILRRLSGSRDSHDIHRRVKSRFPVYKRLNSQNTELHFTDSESRR